MTALRYPPESLRGDYVRAAVGLALTLGPAVAIPPSSPAMFGLVPAAVLFLAFGVRTWRRRVSRVVVSGEEISLFCPRRVSLAWTDVRSVRLAYFSTRADRTGGWMQMTLKGFDPQRHSGMRVIRVDSTLEGFDRVARRAAEAAAANRLDLSNSTRANFAALGIDLAP